MAQTQGYKIIGSNILQSMLKSKLQIRENVNKRIGICENLVLFCLSCKSPQVEKEKKKGMMDINLRYAAAWWHLYEGTSLSSTTCWTFIPKLSSILRKNEHIGG